MRTPRDAGFFMPAEWAPHKRCWMAWPCHAEWWGDAAGLRTAGRAYAAVATAIARFEPVVMVARPDQAAEARAVLGTGADITVVEAPLSDSWTRDTGPSFVIDGKGGLAGVDWGFNAWGLNYTDFAADAALARRILAEAGARRFVGPMIFEGGAISVDGQGTALTTEQCLLNPNRNPHMTRADIEAALRDFLGIDRLVWLKQGLENDETDGHVDEVASFVAPGRVLILDSSDPTDPNTATLAENHAILRDAGVEVLTVPQPSIRRDGPHGRITTSYANFYIANGGVIVPAYDDPMDREAEAVFRAAFPDRQVVMVPSLDIAAGGGNIHCITQQEPLP